MSGIDLLYKFANSIGVSHKKVEEFLSQYQNPKTISDLSNIPHELLYHASYISDIGQPLRSFIGDEMWCERYRTIDLDEVAECLYDRKYSILSDLNLIDEDDDDFVEKVDVRKLNIEDKESLSRLMYLDEVEKYIVDIKFGSVEYDW